jgi:hypothetical protein
MTSERDRMLSEGPRMAPEPQTADAFTAPAAVESTGFESTGFESADEQPRAMEPPAAAKPPLLKARPQGSWGSSSGSWLNGSLLRRLIPVLLVLAVIGRGLVGGHSGSWAFALVWVVAAVLILALRMRGRRRW